VQLSLPLRTYIVFLHGRYGCVVDGKHQCLVGGCEAGRVTVARIADHLRDGWNVNNPGNGINVLREYIQKKRYLRRKWVKLAEIGGGGAQIVLKQECMAL
jgi:hypothetical protein